MINADLLKQLQEAVSALNKPSESQEQFQAQQAQLNDSRLDALNKVLTQESVGQDLSTADKFAMGLGNMYGSFRRGDGFTAGLSKTLNDLQAREDSNREANLSQVQTASRLANSTRLEAPPEDVGAKEAFKVLQMQMKNAFDQASSEAEAERKSREADAKFQRDKQMAELKSNLSNKNTIAKESRKELGQLVDAEFNAKAKLAQLKEVEALFEEYSKDSWFGTGPFATKGGLSKFTNERVQKLDSRFKSLNLNELVTMANGMSKLFDSDGERRVFESAQPAITNDDNVNRELFKAKIQAAESLLNKIQRKKLELDPRRQRLEELRNKYRGPNE